MTITLLAAVARNGVIGRGKELAWRLPEDQKRFRAVTMGAPVLMGRSTWDSIPARFRPLPGRHNVVLTRQPGWLAEGADVAHTLDDAIARARARLTDPAQRIWVIGGAEVYRLALPIADELDLCEIERDFEGDVFFPPWPREQFEEVERSRHRAEAPNDFDYSFVTYRRRR